MNIGRREVLCGLGGLGIGCAASGLVKVAQAKEAVQAPMQAEMKRFEQVNGAFGWTPHKLDPAECAAVGYEGYWHKGYACGYGVFYALVGLMGEKFGAPYNQFPFAMLEANKGGISDWGTICGALYGATAAFALFWGRNERTPMVNELYRWYESTALPLYKPGESAQGVKGDLPTNTSGSVLCHISVSKWCHETGNTASSKARSERCGRITADVSFKACQILNAKIDAGKDWKGTLAAPASLAACGECHGKGKDADIVKGVMDCTPCHSGNPHLGDKFKNHP